MKREQPQDHCVICREIREGCEAELQSAKAGQMPRCSACSNKGYIDLGDGNGVACNQCPRGFRMKLWLKHHIREDEVIRIAA